MKNACFKWSKFYLVMCFVVSGNWVSALDHNFFNEKVMKLEGHKKAIYVDDGVFYNSTSDNSKKLMSSVRYNYSNVSKVERIVFDFGSSVPPGVYAYIDHKTNKLFIDFFNGVASDNVKSTGKSKFVKELHFYSITDDILSVEVQMKDKKKFDIFYLETPGRLVVDVK